MANWKTIRIFISSTFRDMFVERDHLVRVVFPELKERCRKKHIHLIDVDLRWGVTEQDAQEGKALDICLDEIDSCRPYFLGLLGQRYGYIPDKHHHSITAQEIFHGVLHNDLPTQIIDLRSILEGKLEGRALSNEQTSALVRCYPWDADKRKHLLRPEISKDEEEVIRTAFAQYSSYQRDRSFFFFRNESLTEKLADDKRNDFFDSDPSLTGKLAMLKKSIRDEGLPCFDYDSIEAFGQHVLEVLWKRIDAEVDTVEAEEDWLKKEAEYHELFIADRTRRFVGRRDALDRMHAFCDKADGPSVLIVAGEPGCGKSALMGRFSEEVLHNHADWLILPHFVGASPGSTSLRLTLRRLCTHLNRSLGITDEATEDIKVLFTTFPELLTKAAEQNKILIVLDAVNQLEKTDNAHTMSWLPQVLPGKIKIVISTLQGEACRALMARRQPPNVEEIRGLHEPEIEEYVTGYLKEIKKEFPNPTVTRSFFSKVKTGNPLYIQVALEELRVFGQFEKVAERVKALPDDIPALFAQVLERIEGDFTPALVKDCMSYIACGRQGMTAEELQALLKGYAPRIVCEAEATKLPDMLWARLYRAFSAYLFERSGVIDFFHGQLREAVGTRYLDVVMARDRYHKDIAFYLEGRWKEPYLRALDELPHQRTKAKDTGGIERVLTDLEFVEAKCGAGMTYDLINDYIKAMALDEKWDGMKRVMEFKRYFTKEAHVLRQYPELTFQQAMNQLVETEPYKAADLMWTSGRRKKPWFKWINKLQLIDPCIMTLEGHDGPVACCAISPDGKRIVSCSGGNFLKIWDVKTGLELTILKGHTDRVTFCSISSDGKRIVSASGDTTLKLWNTETGAELITLKGHDFSVDCCAISPDGKRVVSGSWDNTLKVWDIKNGVELTTLRGHSWSILSCAISSNGKRIVSGSADNTLKVWDMETGAELATLKGHVGWVKSCVISSDGLRIVSGSADNTLKVWDMETGAELATLKGHTKDVQSCAISTDGQRIVSGSDDKTLKVWDMKTGAELATLTGHIGWVKTCAISPDGKHIVSGSFDGAIKIWNIEIGDERATFKNHKDQVTSCAISPDGKRVVSGSWDNTLKVWDIKNGVELTTLRGHADRITSCVISPDGKRVVSGSYDNTIKIWDIEKGKELSTLKGHKDRITACAISPDGRCIVTGYWGNILKIWDIETGKELSTLKGHKDWITSCVISPDGKRIVSGSYDNTLKVWDMKAGTELATLKSRTDWITSCAISPDGKRVVSGSSGTQGILWDRGYQMPRGKNHTSKSHNNTIMVWDMETGAELPTRIGHMDQITSCTINSDGKRIITGSNHCTFKIWNINTGMLYVFFVIPHPCVTIDAGCEGSIVAGDDMGHIYILKLMGDEEAEVPLLTPVHVWSFNQKQWENDSSVQCQCCEIKFAPNAGMIDAVSDIAQKAGLTPSDSPCLRLPREAWEDPRLHSECPNCHKPLRFNPFIVDNRPKQPRWQFWKKG